MKTFVFSAILAKQSLQGNFSFARRADLVAFQGNFLNTFFAEPEIVFLAAEASYREKRVKDDFFEFSNHFLDFWFSFEF